MNKKNILKNADHCLSGLLSKLFERRKYLIELILSYESEGLVRICFLLKRINAERILPSRDIHD